MLSINHFIRLALNFSIQKMPMHHLSSISQIMDKAEFERKNGNLTTSLDFYTKSIHLIQSKNEKNKYPLANAKLDRAILYIAMKNFKKAEADIQSIFCLNTSAIYTDVYRKWFNMYLTQNKLGKAIKILKKAITSSPECVEMNYEIGKLYLLTNKKNLSLYHLKKAQQIIKDDSWLELNKELIILFKSINPEIKKLDENSKINQKKIYQKIKEIENLLPRYPFNR